MINDNQPDELIFDFLEGNLSQEEREAFLILNEESESFNRQVRLWQNTYISDPLPSVELLEKKLLIYSNRPGTSFLARFFTTLVIMVIYLAIPGDQAGEQSAHTNLAKTHASRTTIPESIQPSNLVFNCPEAHKSQVSNTLTKQPIMAEESEVIYHSVMLSDLGSEALYIPQRPFLRRFEIDRTENTNQPSAIVRKKWSGKQTRQVRKKLVQDARTRRASEFLKGKMPYVVPLNNNNF